MRQKKVPAPPRRNTVQIIDGIRDKPAAARGVNSIYALGDERETSPLMMPRDE